ncbi:autotransporter assembly complex protein TamA [Antarcticirhabdus aurantiaca]|uniref:Autotransporter assembly complex protein TamA n=1 Tax=Antarcticirhabdus aurantiaca TaxID=2606717 RepID=A0ACD4NLM9_9HYPH|nr:autotransporter assembly complex family protein [Antarcticirhabdus aurantiaca]WAJ27683.1 autotransporter assembly complex protein TamA [Jeongeuplla avenae]
MADGAAPARALELFGFKFFEREDEPDELVIDPIRYAVTLQAPGAGDDLTEDLNNASTLVSGAEEPVSGSLGLLSRARNDRRRLVAALFENARYEGLVDIFIEGRNVADLPPDASFNTAGGPVPVVIRVQPGRTFTLGAVRVNSGGVPVDPSQYGLVPGGSAASVDVLQAESNVFRDLRDDGRPFVAVTQRDVIADVPPARLDYSLGLSPGPRVPFGTTYVQGTRAVDPGFVAYMAGVERGAVFSPELLDRSRERLQKLGVFSSVTVKEAAAQAPDGTLPVQVEVAERKFGFYGVGATYSNTEGAGTSGYVGYRNLFGRAESIRLDAAVSRIGATALSGEARERSGIDFSGSLVFTKPGVLGPDSVYVGSLEVKREQPLAYDRESYAATSGVQYEIDENQSLEVRLRGEYEEITDYLGTEPYILASLPATYTFDNRDNELNPTEGFRFQALLEPTYEFENQRAFVKARLDASTYLSPLESDRFVLAGRLAYGNVFGANLQDVPNDRRFYAGGGGSVRGYEFQSIGPYYPDTVPPGSGYVERFTDTPTGGLTLFEGSLEARIGITETIQIVPFIDGGSVSDDLTPDFSNLKFGAGLGARYLTGFGPIRVDVGIPLDPGPRDASFQFYAGIGQAF